MDVRTLLTKTLFAILVASLGIRSIVPSGLMISGGSNGPLGLQIILCDSKNGLGSVPAFKPKAAEHTHHNHGHQAETSQGHHEENTSCEECNLLWTNSGFDDALQPDSETQTDYLAPPFHIGQQQSRKLDHRLNLYSSRAPPASFS